MSVNGEKLSPLALVLKLNKIGAAHGVGIADLVENRLVGMKSRGVYETPGGSILFYAHRELEALTLDRATLHYKEQMAVRYAELVYDGMWFSPLREALDAFREPDAADGDRHGPRQALQGQHYQRWRQIALFPLQ